MSSNTSDTGQAQNLGINLRNFLLIFWRRKILILFIMLLSVGAVFYFVNTVQPRYTANALVIIEDSAAPESGMEALTSNKRVDMARVLSEAEILKSRNLARKVIDRLDLMNDSEFNPRLRTEKQNQFVQIFDTSQKTKPEKIPFKTFSGYKQESTSAPLEMIGSEEGVVVDRFLRHVHAFPVSGSFVLQVEFTSEDSKKAALVANTIVDLYLDQYLEQKNQTTKKLSIWLDKRLEDLSKQIHNSENAVKNFQTNIDFVSGARAKVKEQQLFDPNSQLVLAKIKRAEAKARLKQIKNWIEKPETIEATDAAQNSLIIQNLKLKESDLLNQISELSSRYGEKHPKMINARKALNDLRHQMKNEMRIIAKSLEADLKIAQARVKALENSLGDVKSTRLDEKQVHNTRLHDFTPESETNQVAFDAPLETDKRVDEQETLQEPQTRVISYATIPNKASYPNKSLFLSLAAAVSFLLGTALALLLEKFDNTYKSALQLENKTGYPCYAIIPTALKLPKKTPIGDYVLDKPASNVAEAIRTLRVMLNLRSPDPDKKTKVVTITSSLPNEGKTTLSTWMSRAIAKSGERVIVIDCDLRRPKLHEAFGQNPKNTLVEYLTGKTTLEEMVFKDPASGAHAIFARSVPNNALDLISKVRMKNLIASLRESYDLVILDTPACLAVSDTRLLASQSDQTLFAVSWNDTAREVVNAGVKQFADFGYDALAFVLTNVDVKRHSRYSYGDGLQHYKQYYSD